MNPPFSVTLSLVLVLIFTAWNFVKIWTLLAWQDVLLEFATSPNLYLSAIVSTVWIIAGIILTWGILQKKVWSKKMLIGTALSYTVWFWSERLIWQNPKTNTVFIILINVVMLIIIYFATREAYERTIENSTTE